MGKVFHVYCNGYSRTLTSLSDTQTYIDWLRANGCVGKEVEIRVGRGDLKAAVYAPGSPIRRETLRAA